MSVLLHFQSRIHPPSTQPDQSFQSPLLTPSGKPAGWAQAGCCSHICAVGPSIGWSHDHRRTGLWVAAPAPYRDGGKGLWVCHIPLFVMVVQNKHTTNAEQRYLYKHKYTYIKAHSLGHELSDIIGKQGRVFLLLAWWIVNRQVLKKHRVGQLNPVVLSQNCDCALVRTYITFTTLDGQNLTDNAVTKKRKASFTDFWLTKPLTSISMGLWSWHRVSHRILNLEDRRVGFICTWQGMGK